MLNIGDNVGIVCCSDGQSKDYSNKVNLLIDMLEGIGFKPVLSDYIFERENVFSGDARERAKALMDMYRDDKIKGIFDISGGDIANGVLPFLDFDVIANSDKLFLGYSDLTTIINAIYAKSGKESVLYQVRNLIYDFGNIQLDRFTNSVLYGGNKLYDFDYSFVQESKMEGTVIGGNIRCFLKLAGTEYMPDFKDKILLLESYGGTVAQMETYLSQLQQLGAFDNINGVLLGTFTQMERENQVPNMQTLVKNYVGRYMPIAVTNEIGHGTNSKAIIIGKKIILEDYYGKKY